MKGPSNYQRKGLFWLGVSALLIWHGPLSGAENVPVPELAKDAGRLEQLGDAVGLAAVEKKLAGMKADRPRALLALGKLLHDEGKDAPAAEALEQALALQPDAFEVERELGWVYNALGQNEKAALLMKKALKQRPQEYELTVELAKCYVRMGRFERAKDAFAQAKRIDGKAAKAYIEQGYAYLDAGQDVQAQREFEDLIAVDSASPIGFHHMGTYFFRRHQYHEAEEYYRRAVQGLEAKPLQNPDDLDHALSNLGMTLLAQGKFAEAEVVYRKGLEQTHPDIYWQSEFLHGLGVIAEAQGQTAKAEQLYQQAMAALDPELGVGLCVMWAKSAIQLAVLYAGQGRKAEAEAEALAERLGYFCGKVPNNDGRLCDFEKLVDLYMDLGQSAKAEALLNRFVAVPEAMQNHRCMGPAAAVLAGLYKKQGRLTLAEALYLKAIEVFKIQGGIAEASNALRGLAVVYKREGKSQEAAAARRQAEALRAQGGKS